MFSRIECWVSFLLLLFWNLGERSGKSLFSLAVCCLSVFGVAVFGGRYVDEGDVPGGCLIDAGAFAQVVVGLRPLMRSKLWCAAAVGTYSIADGCARLILSVKLFSRRLNGEIASLYIFSACWALFKFLKGTKHSFVVPKNSFCCRFFRYQKRFLST